MTKTAIAMRDLDERARHNKELERQGRINTILSGISNIGSTVIKAISPKTGIISAAKALFDGDSFQRFKNLHEGAKTKSLSNSDYREYQRMLKQIKGGNR